MPASQKLIEANQRIGRELRQRALDRYYENPNHCLNCGEVLRVKDNQKIADVRANKFCSKSCAAKFNNIGVNRWKNRVESKNHTKSEQSQASSGPCERCGTMVDFRKRKDRDLYYKRRFCDPCYRVNHAKNGRNQQEKEGKALPKPLLQMAKMELREHYTWHLTYKATIGKNARKVFNESGRRKVCQHCGFVHGIQVCHIKDIAEFVDSALIAEINDPTNLVALCPNCHWLFDHAMLKI